MDAIFVFCRFIHFLNSDFCKKMDAVEDESSSIASKCLALGQTLVGKSAFFNIGLTIGSTFEFGMSTGRDIQAPKSKKRKSPSTIRRDARRKKKFLMKKSQSKGPESDSLESRSLELARAFEMDNNLRASLKQGETNAHYPDILAALIRVKASDIKGTLEDFLECFKEDEANSLYPLFNP